MNSKKELDLVKAPFECKIERYAYGEYRIDIIDAGNHFEAQIFHPESFFAEWLCAVKKKDMVGTKFEVEIDHDLFLKIVKMGLPSRIEDFRKRFLFNNENT